MLQGKRWGCVMEQFRIFAGAVNQVVRCVCQGLLAVLVVGQLTVVVLRYVFGVGFIELQDAVLYSFAALVVLGLPVAQADDAHVRVDVFRAQQSKLWQGRFDDVGVTLLLLPFFGLTILWVWPDVSYSWSIFEGSVETGGLPGLFLVKSCLPLACALMILQGLAGLVGRHG